MASSQLTVLIWKMKTFLWEVLESSHLQSHLLCEDRKHTHHYLTHNSAGPFPLFFPVLVPKWSTLCKRSNATCLESRTLTQQLHKEKRRQLSLETATVQSPANRHASKWGKGSAVLGTRWRLLSGIFLPRTHCHATNGNPRQSWIPFQRNVCERLTRRTVIEGRTGFNERQPTKIRPRLQINRPDKKLLQHILALHMGEAIYLHWHWNKKCLLAFSGL